MRTENFQMSDDGSVPNNPDLPLLIYHDAFDAATPPDDIIAHLGRNGWRGAWVNGIFDYHHYHARSHEVLVNVGAPVTVQFGGAAGPVVEFAAGSAVVIPAGCGHCRQSASAGLVIVGAYPAGQEDWDLKRGDRPADYAIAKQEIASVALPEFDPIGGRSGVLFDHWKL